MTKQKSQKKAVTGTGKSAAPKAKKPASTKTSKPGRSVAAQKANRRDRRKFIMDAAAKLFSKSGYQATTMDRLSEVTGLNKGTIYYYYKSKADILYDMCASTSESLATDLQSALEMEKATDGLAQYMSDMLRWVYRNQEYCQVYFQEAPFFNEIFMEAPYAAIRAEQRQSTSMFYKLLAKGCASGEFKEFDVTYTGRLIRGLLLWTYRWPEADDEIDIDKMVATACALVLNGLLPD